jgi:hypothetical protein
MEVLQKIVGGTLRFFVVVVVVVFLLLRYQVIGNNFLKSVFTTFNNESVKF